MTRDEDFSIEEQETQTGYFSGQANSEFKSIVARMKRDERKGKLIFLRSIGRKERLKLNQKHGRTWQEVLGK